MTPMTVCALCRNPSDHDEVRQPQRTIFSAHGAHVCNRCVVDHFADAVGGVLDQRTEFPKLDTDTVIAITIAVQTMQQADPPSANADLTKLIIETIQTMPASVTEYFREGQSPQRARA